MLCCKHEGRGNREKEGCELAPLVFGLLLTSHQPHLRPAHPGRTLLVCTLSLITCVGDGLSAWNALLGPLFPHSPLHPSSRQVVLGTPLLSYQGTHPSQAQWRAPRCVISNFHWTVGPAGAGSVSSVLLCLSSEACEPPYSDI